MELAGHPLSLTDLARVALHGEEVGIASSAHEHIHAARRVIEDITAGDAVVYGVNTGFGKLSEVHIERGDLRQLQLNLVRSHACGVGAPLAEPEVRAMMLLRANVLTLGFSGIRLEVIQLLAEMLESRRASDGSGKGIGRRERRSRAARASGARARRGRRSIFQGRTTAERRWRWSARAWSR